MVSSHSINASAEAGSISRFLTRLRLAGSHKHEFALSREKAKVAVDAVELAKLPPISPEDVKSIRKILLTFMRDLDIKYKEIDYDVPFARSCCVDALNYGFLQEDIDSPDFQKALHGSVAIARNTYKHLENIGTQRWIALYTVCLIFFDDLTQTDPSHAREFHQCFMNGQKQKHPLLDGYASLLRAAHDHFNPSAANLVVSSSLDFVTGLILDYDHKNLEMHPKAISYPRYFRTMMGVSTAFVIYTFPPHISLEVYIQILPNMVNFIDDVNDIFSFYKEELKGEDTNHISILANMHKCSKLESMKYLADYSVAGARRARDVLASHPEAYEIYTKHFLQGYVDFHAAASVRYKLPDLKLTESTPDDFMETIVEDVEVKPGVAFVGLVVKAFVALLALFVVHCYASGMSAEYYGLLV